MAEGSTESATYTGPQKQDKIRDFGGLGKGGRRKMNVERKAGQDKNF